MKAWEEREKRESDAEVLSPLGREMSTWKLKSIQLKSSLERYAEEQDAGSGKGVAKLPGFVKDKAKNFSNHDDVTEWVKHEVRAGRPKMTEMQRLMHKPTQRERGRRRKPLEADANVGRVSDQMQRVDQDEAGSALTLEEGGAMDKANGDKRPSTTGKAEENRQDGPGEEETEGEAGSRSNEEAGSAPEESTEVVKNSGEARTNEDEHLRGLLGI